MWSSLAFSYFFICVCVPPQLSIEPPRGCGYNLLMRVWFQCIKFRASFWWSLCTSHVRIPAEDLQPSQGSSTAHRVKVLNIALDLRMCVLCWILHEEGPVAVSVSSRDQVCVCVCVCVHWCLSIVLNIIIHLQYDYYIDPGSQSTPRCSRSQVPVLLASSPGQNFSRT